MNLIAWLVLGALVGWLASLLMRLRDRQVVVLNAVVGLLGAFLAGWFVAPLAGIGGINQIEFSAPSMVVSLFGALVLVALLNLARRRPAR